MTWHSPSVTPQRVPLPPYPRENAYGMTGHRPLSPRLSWKDLGHSATASPERCLRHDRTLPSVTPKGSLCHRPPEREAYGMTWHALCHLACPGRTWVTPPPHPPRDAYGMTGHRPLSPRRGLSATVPQRERCLRHDMASPSVTPPLDQAGASNIQFRICVLENQEEISRKKGGDKAAIKRRLSGDKAEEMRR